MKIEILESEFKGKDVLVVAKFAVSLEELHGGSFSRDFEGVYKTVAKNVAEEISQKIMAEKSSEIISQINIDEIINRIKLNIVQSVARN